MTFLQRFLAPVPARPAWREPIRVDFDALPPAAHDIVLDALRWSDMDSSHDLVNSTKAARDALEKLMASSDLAESRPGQTADH